MTPKIPERGPFSIAQGELEKTLRMFAQRTPYWARFTNLIYLTQHAVY
jgi:hypothetical protein